MKSRLSYTLAVFLVLLIVLAGLMVVSGSAQGNYPEGVDVFEIPSGHWCVLIEGDVECYCPCEVINVCEPTPIPTYVPEGTPTPEPTKKSPTKTPPRPNPTETPIPTNTPEQEWVFCHCEQGEGEGAIDRKNCHVAKYNNGHANHEWDYWSDTGTCEGWHH